MRVTVEVDRHCVTYFCVACREQLDWDELMPANAGTAFVAAHRFCEDTGAGVTESDELAQPALA